MERVLLSIFAAALLAGCQVQDPFAAFGPPRVPSPTTAQTAPYYPPTGSASKQPSAQPAAPAKAPPGGKTTPPQSGIFRTDAAVTPAAFVESPSADGQWRSR